MGEESAKFSNQTGQSPDGNIPPTLTEMLTCTALGVAPPSLSAESSPEYLTGEDCINSGDCDCEESSSLELLGNVACEASDCSWSFGAELEGAAEFLVARLGVAEEDERPVRCLGGEDILRLCYSETSMYRVVRSDGCGRWAVVNASRARGRS